MVTALWGISLTAWLLALSLSAHAEDGRAVTVYYATNRVWDEQGKEPGFSTRDAESLTWGTVAVTEHGLRLPGQDKPLTPEVPVQLTEAATLDLLVGRGLPVLVVVHGYNTSWTWAAREAAQLAMDLEDQGTQVVPLLFSWPSGGLVRYPPDENAASRSVPRFQHTLREVVERVPDGQVDVVAHSMGARVVSAAIHELWSRPERAPKHHLDDVVLASADIDTLEFRERYLPSVLDASDRTTLYVTINDRALAVSERIHGGYPRLGQIGLGGAPDEVEIVDTGPLDRGATKHSTFRQSELALEDLAQLLRGLPAATRGLVRREDRWTFGDRALVERPDDLKDPKAP